MRADERSPSWLTAPTKLITNSFAGLLVELPRRADLLDPAVAHHDDLVGDLHRLLLVVRDEDRRHVHLVVQPAQPRAQVLAHARVERAERLVEQQHLGLDRERAGERHPLALAAGELRGIALGEARRAARARAARRRARVISSFGRLRISSPNATFSRHGHVLEGRVVLEDEADAALLRRERGRVVARRSDRARVGLLEPGDDAQQRRLAAAARAEQRGQRPRSGRRPRRRRARRTRRTASRRCGPLMAISASRLRA